MVDMNRLIWATGYAIWMGVHILMQYILLWLALLLMVLTGTVVFFICKIRGISRIYRK